MTDGPLRLMILARDQSPKIQNAWSDLRGFLDTEDGVEIVAKATTDDETLEPVEADPVVVLGGDGAILRACRQLGTRQLPIIGVNLGRLGFLADLAPDEFRENFHHIRDRNYRVVEHLMFQCRYQRADGASESYLGLNEVAVSSGASLAMLDVHLAINGESVTTYSGDGLIVSTPVGSTAHNLSAGGPILRQDLDSFVITPICPHTLTVRPLVDCASCVYTLTVPEAPDGAMLVVDGQIKIPLNQGDVIEVAKAPVTFKLARIPEHSYYATLHRKLGWGGQPLYYSNPPDA